MKISVITPVYDDYYILSNKLLPSIKKQTIGMNNIEVIVVDDGSNITNVDTPDWIKFVRLPGHFGGNTARNMGTMVASGDYYIYPDADCELFPDCLKMMSRYLDVNREIDFVYSHFLQVDEDGWVNKFQSLKFTPKTLLNRNYISVVTMFRKECYLGWNTKLQRFQDWEMWIRMSQKGYVGALLDDVLFFHFLRKKSITQSTKTYEDAKNEMLMELGLIEVIKQPEESSLDKIKDGNVPGVKIIPSSGQPSV